MKRVLLATILAMGFSSAAFAADGKALAAKCVACHGASFEKVANGKSEIVKGWSSAKIEEALKGYKAGTRNAHGMGALMKGQMASFKSDAEIKAVSDYIASIK